MEIGTKLDKYEKLADSARLMRAADKKILTANFSPITTSTVTANPTQMPIDSSSVVRKGLKDDAVVIGGNKITFKEAGLYSLYSIVNNLPSASADPVSPVNTILWSVVYNTESAPSIQNRICLSKSSGWVAASNSMPPLDLLFWFNKDDFICIWMSGSNILSGGTWNPITTVKPYNLIIAKMEDSVPDVYAEKFAVGDYDYNGGVIIGSNLNPDFYVSGVVTGTPQKITITQRGLLRCHIQANGYTNSGAFASLMINDDKQVMRGSGIISPVASNQTVETNNSIPVSPGDVVWVRIYNQTTIPPTVWTTSLTLYPCKDIRLIKPTVLALPGGIDFIAETQTGWYEVTAGNFKAKYSQRFPFTSIALGTTGVNTTLGTIAGGFKLLDAWGDYMVDGSPSIGNVLPINRYNNPSLTQQSIISIVRSGNDLLLGNLLSTGVTGQAISGEVSAVYTKTTDATYTLDQILAMNPPTP